MVERSGWDTGCRPVVQVPSRCLGGQIKADVIVVSCSVTLLRLWSPLSPNYREDKRNSWAWHNLATTTMLGCMSSISYFVVGLVSQSWKLYWFMVSIVLSSGVDIWISGSFTSGSVDLSPAIWCKKHNFLLFSWSKIHSQLNYFEFQNFNSEQEGHFKFWHVWFSCNMKTCQWSWFLGMILISAEEKPDLWRGNSFKTWCYRHGLALQHVV